MGERDWKPGDVANYDNVRVFRVDDGSGCSRWIDEEGDERQGPALRDARPLVVIDPEDREQVERLTRIYYHDGGGPLDELASRMQAALRGFVNPKPQKPEEPQGLGAVVEDGAGSRFVRSDVETCNPWRGPNGLPWEWSDIDAVRVLSEGVTP